MAKVATDPAEVEIKSLKLDRNNPRMPDTAFESDEEVVKFLIEDCQVEELVQSILASGWIDYEPLIVEKATNVVFEGNRRLAALKLISEPTLRKKVGYLLPQVPHAKEVPKTVRVRFVNTRQEARQYIAFKHITGPLKWDSYAKAKYAAEWLKEGADIDLVSRTLGDTHSTVRRLVNGFNVLEQAKKAGFETEHRSKKRFSFSHLYTAVSRPAVRKFLGLPEDAEETLSKEPIPKEGQENLSRLMSWLYGQENKKEPTLVISQNPNLNQLIDVIGHETARAELLSTRSLERAYLEIEPQSKRFKDALIRASRECESALGLSSHYRGDQTELEIAKNLLLSARNLRDSMVKKQLSVEDSE